MERWIVTGGCGFVGSNLTASLLRDGIDAIVFDNLSRVGSAQNLKWLQEQASPSAGVGRLQFVEGDTRRQSEVDKLLAAHDDVTAIAHLAGQVAMTTSIERPRHDFEVNALGSINILEAVRRHSPEASLIFSSSNKVYGDLLHLRHRETESRWTLPDFPDGLDEFSPLSFQSPYGCSKGAADQYFLDYQRIYGLKTTVFRHSSMYGGRQFATFDQGWIGWFCQQMIEQRTAAARGAIVLPFTVAGDGKQVRDLLHADDVVDAYRAAAKTPNAVGQAYNLGGGFANSRSIIELLEELSLILDWVPKLEFVEARPHDQRFFVANTAKAFKAFGFSARVSASEGLKRLVEWISSAPVGSIPT